MWPASLSFKPVGFKDLSELRETHGTGGICVGTNFGPLADECLMASGAR